jgi:hypothetical protein
MSFTRTATMATLAALAATTALVGAPTASAATSTSCVTVYDFPDAGEKVCVFTEGPCLIGEYRTTIFGTEFRCLVARP